MRRGPRRYIARAWSTGNWAPNARNRAHRSAHFPMVRGGSGGHRPAGTLRLSRRPAGSGMGSLHLETDVHAQSEPVPGDSLSADRNPIQPHLFMKPLLIILGVALAVSAGAQPFITNIVLDPHEVIVVPVAQDRLSAIVFPSPIAHLEGAFLALDTEPPARFQINFKPGNPYRSEEHTSEL